ncbi:unnamed protein product [Cylindrotheca closterium]|uniref:Uncharacterized protein n=1 Tax=Cylindrotheca closterium TaxID=2856 RepID=A0AAD2JHR7_9STRA|nr:unnamed protein product [Cylindrotheca closterium]
MMATMMNHHKRNTSRDNSYSNDEFSFQESADPKLIVVEHIDENNLSLLESSNHGAKYLHEDPIKNNNNYEFGEEEEGDCTTITLSTTTSNSDDRSGSRSDCNSPVKATKRLLVNPWAARFVPTHHTQQQQGEVTIPLPLTLDQTHTVSPLSTPSPTNQKSRKVFTEDQQLPPLKQFGAKSDAPLVAALQIQSLEAIMAKKKKQNEDRWGHWWSKEQQEKEHQEQQRQQQQMEEDSTMTAESTTSSSMKSTGEKSASFRWGRFLGSSNNTLDGDETTATTAEEEEEEADCKSPNSQRQQRKSWKQRFSFQPSHQMDTMLDDIDDPYLDSISLGSESSSSSYGDGSISSVYSLEQEESSTNDEDTKKSQIKGSENDITTIPTTRHRRRWSRLWRAQEFSCDSSPTVHMI